MKSKALIIFLIFAIMMCQLAVFASAVDTEAVYAKIDLVYGGADGIISMTFDDGYSETASLLNQMFEKYDLKGSLMIIGSNSSTDSTGYYLTSSTGNKIFANGRLEPQAHSMTHVRLSDLPAESANATFQYEMVESKALIESMFPDYDILSFAIPHGTMDESATSFAQEYYYAMRTNVAGVQSLDPGFTHTYGSWAAMYAPATYRLKYNSNYNDEVQWALIKSDIDKAANGWYIPLTHRVGDVDGTDMSYAVADQMFSYIASLRNDGKVWVATYSEAIKYVRERQNTTLTAKKVGGNISLVATLAEKTQDGLALDKDVFNQPLTVKVEVDSSCEKVYYTDGCIQKSVDTFTEGSKCYARIEIVPNGEELVIYPEEQEKESLAHDYTEVTCSAPATCKVCGYTTGATLAHDFTDATCDDPKTCTVCQSTEGDALGHNYIEATCTTPKTCLTCGKEYGNTARHDYIAATCTEPRTCRVCGTQTGNPLGHSNDNTTCADTKCTRCNEMIASTKSHSFTAATCTEAKSCTSCGLTEGTALGHTVSSNTCASILCTRCKTLVPSDKSHEYVDATCTKPQTCTNCGATNNKALGHTLAIDATDDPNSHKSVCSVCLETINESEPHSDIDGDGICDGCNATVSTDGGGSDTENSSPIVIILIAVAAVAVIGAVAVIIIRKKHTK